MNRNKDSEVDFKCAFPIHVIHILSMYICIQPTPFYNENDIRSIRKSFKTFLFTHADKQLYSYKLK